MRNKAAVFVTGAIACLLMLSALAITTALIHVRALRDRAVAAEAAKAVSESLVVSKLRESYLLQAKGRAEAGCRGSAPNH